MYRTGDTAMLLPSGLLEITGRVGAMIKVRGYSIVPGKVENAITEKLAVSQCAVVAHGEGLQRQLVAYVVHEKDEVGTRKSLTIDASGFSPMARRTLEESLAQYMIPAVWIELDKLPTSEVSGKVDLKKLPSPTTATSRHKAFINGSTAVKDKNISIDAIAEMWALSLNTPASAITEEHNFFDLGGHSLTLADLAGRLSRTYGCTVPLARLVVNPTLKGHLEVVISVRDGHTAAVQADLPATLRADSILPEDILSRPGAEICSLNDAETILLTGATGYLGAFILSDLLKTTSARVICLVRFNDPDEDDQAMGIARLRRNLLDLGLWKDSMLDRIEVLPGNLARKQIGLASDEFEDLATRIQVIIHSAATVNLVYPYASLRSSNVNGTKEIIRLAGQSGATLQYISTNGVLPPSADSWSEESMIEVDDVPDRLVDGYGQTKWVAEKLIHDACDRGLPVRILRLGTISGHSTSGSTNPYDLFTALIVESLHLGYAPDIKGWRAEMTPVDFVSKAIITLSNNTEITQRVFHIGDSNPVDTQNLFGHLHELGYPTEKLPWEDWVALWTEKRGATKGGVGAFTVDSKNSLACQRQQEQPAFTTPWPHPHPHLSLQKIALTKPP